MRVAVWVNPVLAADVGVRIDREHHTAAPVERIYTSNPSDDAAVAEALGIEGSERTAVFGLGPERADPFLRSYLAAGVDDATRIWDQGLDRVDEVARARIVASTVRQWSADVVLCGDRLGETGANVLGPMVAELLSTPHVTGAMRIVIEDDQLVVQRRADGFLETVRCPIPAVVAVDRGRPLPYPTLPNRLRARTATIGELNLGSLGMDRGRLPPSSLEVVSVSTPKPQRKVPFDTRPAIDRTIGLLLGGGGSTNRGVVLDGAAPDTARLVAERCLEALGTA
jgi:electron transfer flavoprotein beta subunit